MSDPFPNIFSLSWLIRSWRRNITRDSLIDFLKSMRLVVPFADIFAANGVTVENIHPQVIPVVIDTVDQLEVPVQPPDPNNLASAVFEPRTVQLRGPHQLLTSAEFRKDAVAIADISASP